MKCRGYHAASALVFGAVAVAHLVRALLGVPVIVGGTAISMAVSWLAVVLAGGLCFWGVRSSLPE